MCTVGHLYRKIILNDDTCVTFLKERGVLPDEQKFCDKLRNGEHVLDEITSRPFSNFHRKGTRFHESRGKHYSSSYGEGDVLGFLIVLPDDPSNSYIPNTYKDKPLVKFKSHLYYEEKDRVAESLKRLSVLPSSKIYFFKNGVCQGEAFLDVYSGAYFPAVSLHKNATVTINYGPRFKHPPPKDQFTYNGMHMKAEEAICEQTMADLLYLTENDGKLRLDTYSV